MNADNPSFRTPEESRRSEEYFEIKKQLTKATEQIDLLNEEALSRIGVITQLEVRLEMAEEFVGKLEEFLANEPCNQEWFSPCEPCEWRKKIAKWRGGK